MATYSNENEQKTPATGVVGTVLGGAALALGSGLFGNSGLFGGSSSAQQQISSLQMENAILKSSNDVDTKLVDVYTELRSQDKSQDAVIAAIDKRLAAIETAAPLREQIVLGQVNAVAQSLASNVGTINASIACIQNTLAGITATYVPAAVVTPTPMAKYNSWSAPSSTATASAGSST